MSTTTTYTVQAIDSAHDFAVFGGRRIVKAKSAEDAVRKVLVRTFGSGVRPSFDRWDGDCASVRLQGGSVFLPGAHTVQATVAV
jgi:hypothetical protein